MQTYQDVFYQVKSETEHIQFIVPDDYKAEYQSTPIQYPYLAFIPWPIKVTGVIFSDGTEQTTAAGGGGGSQTPWLSNIDGAGFSLSNAGSVSTIGNITAGGCFYIGTIEFACGNGSGAIDLTNIATINGVPPGGGGGGGSQTPWLQNINGAGFSLNNAGAITLANAQVFFDNASGGNDGYVGNYAFGGAGNMGLVCYNTSGSIQVQTYGYDVLVGANRNVFLQVDPNSTTGGTVGIGHNSYGFNSNYMLTVQGDVDISDPGGANGFTYRINGVPISGGGGTPAPPLQSVQWNNNNAFGGSGTFIFDNVNLRLGVGNDTTVLPDANATDIHLIVGPTTSGGPFGEITACGNTTVNGAAFGSINFANYARSAAEKRMGVISGVTTSSGSNYGGIRFQSMNNQTLDAVGIFMTPTNGGTNLAIGLNFASQAIDVLRNVGASGAIINLVTDTTTTSVVQGSSYIRSSGLDLPGMAIRGMVSRGTLAASTAIQAGDIMLRLDGLGNFGPGTFTRSSSIQLIADGNWASGSLPSAITFSTTLTTGMTEWMRITSLGRVGIGTTAPTSLINGVSQDPALTLFSNTDNGDGTFSNITIAAVSNSTTDPNLIPWADSAAILTQQGIELVIAPSDAVSLIPGAGGVYAVPITTGAGGYAFAVDFDTTTVGVHTVSPNATLEVAGTILASTYGNDSTAVGMQMGYDTVAQAGFLVSADNGAGQFFDFDLDGKVFTITTHDNGWVVFATTQVGINNPTPGYALDINGSCNITGQYLINGVPLAAGQNQTPWLSDINAANFNLTNCNNVGIGSSNTINPLRITCATGRAGAININGQGGADFSAQIGFANNVSTQLTIGVPGAAFPNTGNTGLVQCSTDLLFLIGASAFNNVMRLFAASGRVGIGTISSPGSLLSLGSTLAPVKLAVFDDGGGSNCYGLGITSGLLYFAAGINPSSGTPQMSLDTSGNLNITGQYLQNGTPVALATLAEINQLRARVQELEARLL